MKRLATWGTLAIIWLVSLGCVRHFDIRTFRLGDSLYTLRLQRFVHVAVTNERTAERVRFTDGKRWFMTLVVRPEGPSSRERQVGTRSAGLVLGALHGTQVSSCARQGTCHVEMVFALGNDGSGRPLYAFATTSGDERTIHEAQSLLRTAQAD